MTEAKENHYRLQVRAALTAGQWDAPAPAKTPHGTFLSWSELFRKFRKHSKTADVPEAVVQTHFLSLLLSSTKVTSKELSGEEEDASSDPFKLGDDCVLFEERREDAQKAFELLQRQQSADDHVRLASAYCAYALDRPQECLDLLSGVTFADSLTSLHSNRNKQADFALLVTSTDEKTEERSISTRSLPLEVEDEKAWVLLEAIRCACLEGMSHERISPGSSSQALSSYDRGIHLLRTFTIPKAPPTRPGHANLESFKKYHELWRWAERLVWRAVVLSARHRSVEDTIPIFRTYTTHSIHWPATFRSSHRSTVCSLYLRALVIMSQAQSSLLGLFSSKTGWTNEMRGVVHEYRAILSATTCFPNAGERNVLVEEFVDFCVAAWESGGAVGDQASWVIDILWWATRLTFNSPRILRHMTRLLHVSGDHELAKRVLRLYVQVVRKVRETGTMNERGEDTHDPEAMEKDRLWVETLVDGARMLCRIPGSAAEAREALTLIVQARERISNVGDELHARVDLADGICRSVLAIRDYEPSTRGKLLSESVELLMCSIDRHSTPAAYFHAALALSRPIPERNLEKAVEFCRKAVEEEPQDVRHWHLLALLEARIGEWKKAKGVIEAAIEIAEDVEMKAQADEMKELGITSKDYGDTERQGTPVQQAPPSPSPPLTNGNANHSSLLRTLIEPTEVGLPPAANLLKPLPDHPHSTHRELFEHALQLRMTQLVLTELVEGSESVEGYWLEVFDWYSQRRDTNAQARSARPSMDARLSPSPAYNELQPQGTSHSMNEISEGSFAIGGSSNGHTNPPSSSLDATTIRATGRTSVETSATNSIIQSSTPTTPSSRKEISRAQSQSPERDKKGKRVQQMLKNQVHKQQAHIKTISRKIGHGVTRGGMNLQRSNSAPDFHAVLTRTGPYQASSIHSRRRLSFSSRSQRAERDQLNSFRTPSPPPPPLPPPVQDNSRDNRNARERKLLSDLWLMSASTFRRLDKLDQTRGAIQEAECLDETNEVVWVQLGLYFVARGEEGKAIESFQKALFISQDDCSATIHLCQLYLVSRSPLVRSITYGAVDLATGMLEALTRGAGWDIPEAWYLLAKAYCMQGRKERERECLVFALGLAEVRGVRDIGAAIGWCL